MMKPTLLCITLVTLLGCGRSQGDDDDLALVDVPDSSATATGETGVRLQSLLSSLCFGGQASLGSVVTQHACSTTESSELVLVRYTSSGQTWNQLRLKDTNLCVELPGATKELRAKAALANCARRPMTRAAHQLFRFDGDAARARIVAKHSGLCLNVDESSLDAGAAIQQWTCGDYANQFFAQYTAATNPPDDEEPPPPSGETVTASFSGTNDLVPNPERGYYCFGESLDNTTSGSLTGCYNRGYRLVFAPTRMDAFRTADLSQAYLDKLTAGFAKYRAAGVKTVLRFVYNYDGGGADASLAQAQRHLQQLAPVLAANADVIGYVQAGFIGAWGEWHTSASGLTSNGNKDALRTALLNAVPQVHSVSFRYPPDVMRWSASPIADSAAFNGSQVSRTGFHNDCFMSSDNDVGTYNNNATTRNQQRDYMAAQTAYAPFGGETCGGFGPNRSTCTDIRREGAQFHLTYLNADYYQPFRDQWQSEGCAAEVERTMGYRFEIDELKHNSSASAGGTLQATVTLRNVGWSRIFSPRPLTVVLVNGSNTIVGESTADLRTIAPSGSATLAITVDIPSSATRGTYAVFLAAPDVYDGTRGDGRFAVRFANADDNAHGITWSASSGRLSTGTSVSVQ